MGAVEPIHILIVLIVVCLLFGANRLPSLGKSLGRGIREFKKGVEEIHTPYEPAAEQGPADEALPARPTVELLPATATGETAPDVTVAAVSDASAHD